MKIHEATEQAYKNGYEDGYRNGKNRAREEIAFPRFLVSAPERSKEELERILYNPPVFYVNKETIVPIYIDRWIPVTERLPELHTKVLCCGKKGGRFIAELSTWGKEEHLCWDKRNGQGCPTVTHWMPLPEPPKEV